VVLEQMAGLGAAIDAPLPLGLLGPQSAIDLTGLSVIGLEGPALQWRVSLATPTARRLSAAARAFVAELIP